MALPLLDVGAGLRDGALGLADRGLGGENLGLLLDEGPLRLLHALLGLADLRLRLAQLRLQIPRIHHGDDLPGPHQVALFDEKTRDAAGELGLDVDHVRFEPAIPGGEARRQQRAMGLPPSVAAPGENQQHDGGREPQAA